MKKRLSLLLLSCFFCFACTSEKPYIPNSDKDLDLQITKNIRIFHNSKVGNLTLDEDAEAFIKEIENAGFSFAKTITHRLETYNEPLSYNLDGANPVITNCISTLEAYIVQLSDEELEKYGITKETQNRVSYHYFKNEYLDYLDAAIIVNDTAEIKNLSEIIDTYSGTNLVAQRRALMKFGGLGGFEKNQKEALDELEKMVADLSKYDPLKKSYLFLKWIYDAENGGEIYPSFDHGAYDDDPNFHIALAYLAEKHQNQKLFELLKKEVNVGNRYIDPFTRYVLSSYILSKLPANNYEARRTKEIMEKAKAELKGDWAKTYLLKQLGDISYYSTIGSLTFYILAPTKEETAQFIK